MAARSANGDGFSMDQTFTSASTGHVLINGNDFGPDSANLTGTWLSAQSGDRWAIADPGGTRIDTTLSAEKIFGVACLKIPIGNYVLWLAKDASGLIHLFAFQNAAGTYTVADAGEFPNYWISETPSDSAAWTWTAGNFGPVTATVLEGPPSAATDRAASGSDTLKIRTTFPDASRATWTYRAETGLATLKDDSGLYTVFVGFGQTGIGTNSGSSNGGSGCFLSTCP